MIEGGVGKTVQEPTASSSAICGGKSGAFHFIAQIAGIALLLGALLVGYSRWRTGSMRTVLPFLAGQRLLVEPTHLDLGDVGKGETIKRKLRVVNLGTRPLKLVGSQSSCGCMSLNDFPIEIPGRTEQSVWLQIATPNEPSVFKHTVKLFSNEQGYSVVEVNVSGKSG